MYHKVNKQQLTQKAALEKVREWVCYMITFHKLAEVKSLLISNYFKHNSLNSKQKIDICTMYFLN